MMLSAAGWIKGLWRSLGELREGLIPWIGYVGSQFSDADDLVSDIDIWGECLYSHLGLSK